MLDGRHHGEGKRHQPDMPMPAMPRPGFVVIEPELVLGGPEAVLDRPTAALNVTSVSIGVPAGHHVVK